MITIGLSLPHAVLIRNMLTQNPRFKGFSHGLTADTTDDPRFSKDAAWEAFERGAK